MNAVWRRVCALGAMALVGMGGWLNAEGAAWLKPSEREVFFPFCIDWHDTKKRDFTQQARMLKELGYEGVGHIWLDKVAERIQSLDGEGLHLFQITMQVDIGPGKQPYDPRLKEVLELVRGRGVQILLLMNGREPSDPGGDEQPGRPDLAAHERQGALRPRRGRARCRAHSGNVRFGKRLGCRISVISSHGLLAGAD